MQDFSLVKSFILENLSRGLVFLATIIEKKGTTFGAVGSKMAFSSKGDYSGLLSGGCFEPDLIEHGLTMDSKQYLKVVSYDLSSEKDLIFGSGSGCPGQVKVLIEKICPEVHKNFIDILQNKTFNITIHPFAYMDGTLNEYLGLSIEDAKEKVASLKQQVKEVGGVFMGIWHNETVTDKGIWKGWRAVYEDAIT